MSGRLTEVETAPEEEGFLEKRENAIFVFSVFLFLLWVPGVDDV